MIFTVCTLHRKRSVVLMYEAKAVRALTPNWRRRDVDVVDVLAQAERLYASFSNYYYLTYVYKLG